MKAFTRIAAIAVAPVMALGIATSAPTAHATVTRSSPTRHVVALEPDYRTYRYTWITMGSRLNVSEGPNGWITRIHWYHWTTQSAAGTGRLWVCDSTTVFAGRVTFRLYRPRGGIMIAGHKHPYFTRVYISAGHGSPYNNSPRICRLCYISPHRAAPETLPL